MHQMKIDLPENTRKAALSGLMILPLALTAPVSVHAQEVLTGADASGTWRSDAPGVRRHIKPADLPPPVNRGDPWVIRIAPNGDVFVAEGEGGRVLVFPAGSAGSAPAKPAVFAASVPARADRTDRECDQPLAARRDSFSGRSGPAPQGTRAARRGQPIANKSEQDACTASYSRRRGFLWKEQAS